ncbi:MAG TPA: hypothetical protein DIW23_07255 [Anaerolineae bacterium]|nr:hypothetical protein [Anaerolineae bacterium]
MINFVGKPNQFVSGIPNRNLSDDEWKSLSEDLQAIALSSGLYVKSDAVLPDIEDEYKEDKKGKK